MPDNIDFIQEQQAELLERQINAARVKHCGVSALVCEECDAPIPAARRAAYPSATRCVSCQLRIFMKGDHSITSIEIG
ncbi:TraR/DksA C4-type zinc finger protein [Escherichia coli]